ncbi:aminoacyl tRNA synthase complex-interacting multifunctional protein 1 [Plodia interpunctella]|uniref:aminoacyl tRNA synthase complex-interacting multifunctional protein 1 n=1 Tax=Plodia interpunctella TaxID=58824 RepID=UPI002367F4A2|nr:aminoacyl tRNA synthase complex-interacting multifunctional protein 1 [Plodia interpunctella]
MVFNVLKRTMSQSVVIRLMNNAEVAEKKILELKNKLEEVKKIKIENKIKELTKENADLEAKVEKVKNELIRLEILNGKKQYPIPGKTSIAAADQSATKREVIEETTSQHIKQTIQQPKKEPAKKNKEKSNDAPTDVVDVRKLDFRIGKIIEVNKHPDADSLYVEKIDCGEEKPRTVVSGLVNHVPIDEMQNRIVMVLCNLKPAKMRGITSEAMVMCASSPEKVEILLPPTSAVPGDLVSCEGFPREPEAQLNPKKKIFETCAPDLKTNDEKIACYKGNPLVIPGKGAVVAPTLKGVSVK